MLISLAMMKLVTVQSTETKNFWIGYVKSKLIHPYPRSKVPRYVHMTTRKEQRTTQNAQGEEQVDDEGNVIMLTVTLPREAIGSCIQGYRRIAP